VLNGEPPRDEVGAESVPGELLDRVQALSAQVDALHDARARELAQELVGAVLAIYGDGLRRIVEVIESSPEAGQAIMDRLSRDGAVASLLLIHDLYPVSLEDRVLEALDTVRPYMESHGGNVELLGIERGVARLRLEGSCNGCAASQATLELAIKQALEEHAPDLLGLEVEGIAQAPANGQPLPLAQTPFELPLVHAGPAGVPPASERGARWVTLGDREHPATGELRTVEAGGVELVLANVGGSLLAYRDVCASCGGALHDGVLAGHMLRCPGCLVEFDLPRAGRAAGGEPLQLTPVPLLATDGLRVAV
jgi:Fe-S cluster biogenesis protein NfuA/nitrite reductase/ring-hydroxylating ferredoxin subunit